MCKSRHWPIDSKAKFIRLYQAGEFGNRAPTWNTPEEFAKSGYTGLVHLRNRIAGGITFYNVEPKIALYRWKREDHPEQFYCSGMAPHEHNLIQGELQDMPGGLYLRYSTLRFLPMRDALAELSHDAHGLLAKALLDTHLNDLSRQWMDYLLEAYEDHVVEFSSFSVCWGTVPGHNTVFWEVRNY